MIRGLTAGLERLVNTVPTPARGPSWCDRAKFDHDICEEREEHSSRWQKCVSKTEFILIKARLGQIQPAAGDYSITFVELSFTEESVERTMLILIDSARVFAGTLRRLVELNRKERAK